ncbi:MAG: tetratricopeptide repeat protein [Deltaproteobacteria bacterium]
MLKTAARISALAATLAAGCEKKQLRGPPPKTAGGARVSSAPLAGDGAATTDGRIAVANLEGQIQGWQAAILRSPPNLSGMANLVALYQTRAQFLGILADYDRAAAEAEARFAAAPDAAGYLARSSARSTFHDFQGALTDLAQAVRLGAQDKGTKPMRASILQAMGKYSEALELRREIAQVDPNVSSLSAEAGLLAELDRPEEADRLFAEAPSHFHDVSPFPIAWNDFQRGMLWEGQGQISKAKGFYHLALERLPAYAPAAGHLAGLEAATGERDSALDRLRKLTQVSDDPEYQGQLADVLAQLGQTAESKAVSGRAAKAFDALLKSHPAAFAERAERFYLGIGGDPRRAVELAKTDLAARQSRVAFEVAMTAASAAGAKDDGCHFADLAMAALPASPKLRYLASRSYGACGRTSDAQRLAPAGNTLARQ